MEWLVLAWAIGIFATVPVGIVGGLLVALRNTRQPVIAAPLGLAIGVLAVPTLLLGAYVLIGWPAFVGIAIFAMLWHRRVTDIRMLELGLSVAWIAAVTSLSAVPGFDDRLGTHGAALVVVSLSPLAAVLVALESGAVVSDLMLWRRQTLASPQ
jgi:hypothetical protein